MRKNGIDVQIIDGLPAEEMKPNSALSISRTDGPFIGQPFHGSLHNILERTVSFAEAMCGCLPLCKENFDFLSM